MLQTPMWLVLAGLSQLGEIQGQKNVPVYRGERYLKVNGGTFYLNCAGKGSPTVLLWSGQGGGFLDWTFVQPEIAKTNRVCSFDSAGFGRSSSVPSDDTFEGNVNTLYQALQEAKGGGPFVLVGQSVGGVEARLFEVKHPELVRGMVLVDSYELAAPLNGKPVPMYELSAEQMRAALPDRSRAQRPVPPTTIEPSFAKLPAPAQAEHLADVQGMIAALDFRKEPTVMESYRETFVTLHNASLRPNSLHGMPLLIITRDGVVGEEEAIQESYLKLSNNSQREVAKGSGHFVQLDDPSIVIAAIHTVLGAQR